MRSKSIARDDHGNAYRAGCPVTTAILAIKAAKTANFFGSPPLASQADYGA